ncbi:heterokaryon incompatibility protein-domain-containing protein [Clohesyomyces aquaticus]|uniref:Heterokaryon incompatibility protein-domain-containing protein n=1 Tax=Clohesyomyces aquaticus TaxID=1231657 RepID=A0A1Y2A5P1_9PLEO|nr:heterokaryon incompatibility protein-domain-containing protein [Clohesyomyces aquaticus]
MPLDKAFEYSALSYCWEDQSCSRTVVCDGRKLQVTPNAKEAMRGLRARTKLGNSYLWVDAICIDQTSTEEKNVQVRNMAEIYTKAKQVCIWLQDNGVNKTARKRIRKIPRLHNGEARDPKEVRKETDEVWLDEISKNPYWSRIWTVQEMALARSVKLYSGSVSLGSKMLLRIHDLNPQKQAPFAAHNHLSRHEDGAPCWNLCTMTLKGYSSHS